MTMDASSAVQLEKLAAYVRTKRGDRPLRTIAEEIGGVSASTLSRIEQGSSPDLPTYLRICKWLDLPADTFVDESLGLKRAVAASGEFSLPDSIEAQLRQEKILPPATVDAISEMIRLAYRATKH
jgi:transcriptional regulator with XRE-family HTH domain